MSTRGRRCRGWASALAALGLIGLPLGCEGPPEPAPPAQAGAWRVRAIRPPTRPTPFELGVDLDGVAGYIRATLVVEHPADPTAGTASRSALYDHLFPVDPEARLRVTVTPPTPPATAPRVTFRVESGGVASESFVEPAVPFFEAGAVVRWTPALAEGDALPATEAEVGRWIVTVGNDVTMAVVRVLGSRRPIGSRLKGAGSPLP